MSTFDPPAVDIPDRDVESFHRLYRARGTVEAIDLMDTFMGRMGYGQQVWHEYRRRVRAILMRDGILQGSGDPGGLMLNGFEEHYWPTLKAFLSTEKGWPESVVSSIEKTSAGIMTHIGSPGEPEFDRRGLVLGYVQSGKTAGFMAALARSADAGYRLFIVLTGMLDTLREQTQGRFEDELIDRTDNWIRMTTREHDFDHGSGNNLATIITSNENTRVICIVKKNTHILQRIIDWLEGAGGLALSQCPTLIIDDEADQASLNTGDRAIPEDRSTINRRITRILSILPRSTYVAYTATPFANVLVEPSDDYDLYPRDFIVNMPEPADYFGASRVFGRMPLSEEEHDEDHTGLDVVREVPLADIDALCSPSRAARTTFVPDMTETLHEALEYFVLTCAVRLARGHDSSHMSMLVHTSFYTDMHESVAELIEGWLAQVRVEVSQGSIRRLEELWVRESSRVDASDMGEEPVAWGRLEGYLPVVLERVGVVVENGKSERRLTYAEDALIQIAVGGNSLSRGLTLEGLCVSYFLRRSMQYDTLLQMGRWFGYRHGYSDLPRIYTTSELADAFEHLATVEEEIRRDIALYDRDGLTPVDFGVRVRTHPEMAITSPGKMQTVVECDVSFSGRTVQTTRFAHRDEHWLERNLEATRKLFGSALGSLGEPETIWRRHLLHRGVPADQVLKFLDAYEIHHSHGPMSRELLVSYIKRQRAEGELESWNVAMAGRVKQTEGSLGDLVPGHPVGLLNRSKLVSSSTPQVANLGVITSRIDMAVDLGLELDEIVSMNSSKQGERIRELRNPPGRGQRMPLLLLYPINPESPGKSANRQDLDARAPIIGLALVFPEARVQTALKYVRANLPAPGGDS